MSMEELKSAMEEHVELMADLVQKFSSELRSALRPAYDNLMGFFHAIDWKVPLLLFGCSMNGVFSINGTEFMFVFDVDIFSS